MNILGFFQRLGRALQLPIAVLPVAALLLRFGQPDLLNVAFIAQAGGAIFDNLALIFAIGVASSWSKDSAGAAALAGAVGYFVLTKAMVTINPEINMGVLAGIITGLVGGAAYNRWSDIKLPDFLSFFGGKRFVPIATGFFCLVLAAIFGYVWPPVQHAIHAGGEWIVSAGALGSGIFGFINRLLIPTGLHHALNNVFWFDTIGLGDLSHFWAGETSADVTWSLGMYMSGFFPCMMFGIPGAALAMVQTAKSTKKKVAIGLVASAALSAFVCGVTEPFEFGFMFLAPGLYVVYALLYGIFTTVTTILGFRAGFSFSAGATDLFFSASLPAAQKTWMILPLGIAAFLVFYVVFRFAIVKFDLKTPGREDDDDLEAEKSAVLANNNYTEVASVILEGLGGKENVKSLENCITRLRLEIKDQSVVDEKKIKSAGVAGVIRPGKNSIQVIVGTKVQFVADEMKKMLK